MNTSTSIDNTVIDFFEEKLRTASVQDGCGFLFSVRSEVGNPALAKIVERELGISQEFFDIVVGHCVVSVIPKFGNRNWIYTDVIQISRYAVCFDGQSRTEGCTFVEAIADACIFFKQLLIGYVKERQVDAKLVAAFAERYVEQVSHSASQHFIQ